MMDDERSTLLVRSHSIYNASAPRYLPLKSSPNCMYPASVTLAREKPKALSAVTEYPHYRLNQSCAGQGECSQSNHYASVARVGRWRVAVFTAVAADLNKLEHCWARLKPYRRKT